MDENVEVFLKTLTFLERISSLVVSEQVRLLAAAGTTLQKRWERTKEMVDLDTSIALYDRALRLGAGEVSNLEPCLAGFSVSLQKRYELTSSREDLDRGIDVIEEALGLIEVNHPHRASYLNNCCKWEIECEEYKRIYCRLRRSRARAWRKL
jgi:hypothetical protein